MRPLFISISKLRVIAILVNKLYNKTEDLDNIDNWN